jgi:hypothetical protein
MLREDPEAVTSRAVVLVLLAEMERKLPAA